MYVHKIQMEGRVSRIFDLEPSFFFRENVDVYIDKNDKKELPDF